MCICHAHLCMLLQQHTLFAWKVEVCRGASHLANIEFVALSTYLWHTRHIASTVFPLHRYGALDSALICCGRQLFLRLLFSLVIGSRDTRRYRNQGWQWRCRHLGHCQLLLQALLILHLLRWLYVVLVVVPLRDCGTHCVLSEYKLPCQQVEYLYLVATFGTET